MSSHRNHSTKHALPPNAVFLDFPRSDGDSSLWPTNTTRQVDEEGCVNYMQHVGLDEPLSVKWRVGVGDAISVALKLQSGSPHVLSDFPSGYRMFDHHKGKADNPRHDVYLFGSDSKARFRSVPEFIPHALWLFGNGSDQCKCKYCTKKPQREITSSMGNLLRNSHSPSPSRPPRLKAEKTDKKKDVLSKPPRLVHLQNLKSYAAVQKANVLKPSSHVQTKCVMLVERSHNLRDASRPPSEGSVPRWFREGELVWCALQTPIEGPAESGTTELIKFWPAIVDEVKLVVQSEPIPAETVPADQIATPWITRQTTAYKVHFLAISRSYLLPDTMVIPYQSYVVPQSILKEMVGRPVDDWDLDSEKMSRFDPCPPLHIPPPSFVDTLTPFATALQIASTLSGFWCLTDEWEAKMSLPASVRPNPPPASLQSAIEFAGSNNASISSAPRGQVPPTAGRMISQIRFQGLWWGGERIWADDLVRLKIPRSCLAPAGTTNIFAPAGLTEKSKRSLESEGKVPDPSIYGAAARGVFMKIESIFITETGPGRECRVSGMLYELAESEWEDPYVPRSVESISISSGPSAAPIPPSLGSSGKPSIPASEETSPFPLPVAPTGYRFRPILAPGFEAIMSLTLISGRYYPCLLQHHLIQPYITRLLTPLGPPIMEQAYLWTLEGLWAGYRNSVDPSKYKSHREKMVLDATKEAMTALEGHIRDRRLESQTEMQVD
ncbi:hypothetical protein B0H15DRAFT_906443 [Mycena belliarum]|uniref:Cryptic loci regulator 2 N-terminal domain-containing protein n=1 Tax=Mycena belliarum TaxID=1033014 RepID=A0AAD6XTA5_9AGAR|nr:hypothetical protein B0H15DRAFT_906443 [Mycena belliae]